MLLLRTFPELVGRSVQNLVEIGLAGPVKRVHRSIRTNSHFYIYRFVDESGNLGLISSQGKLLTILWEVVESKLIECKLNQ